MASTIPSDTSAAGSPGESAAFNTPSTTEYVTGRLDEFDAERLEATAQRDAQVAAQISLFSAALGRPMEVLPAKEPAAPIEPEQDAESESDFDLESDGASPESSEFQATLQRLSEGHDDAAWELIQFYAPLIERVVRRRLDARLRSKFDSQDFVQMVWASFFRHRSKFNTFSDPTELIRYLSALAKHKVIDETRRRNTKKYDLTRECGFPQDSQMQPVVPDAGTPSQMAIARECWEQITENEPDEHKKIMDLRVKGLTYQEIADNIGMHERSVRKIVTRLLQKGALHARGK